MAYSRKIPGVIIMYLLLLIIAQWPARKHPSLTALTMAAAIFLTLLVGYELESERLGEAVIVSRGQPYHQPYLLSWMALLAVRWDRKRRLIVFTDIHHLTGYGRCWYCGILDAVPIPDS